MPTIGEFARYLGISVRMLRHYDTLGLLVPASVDPVTGYRHYRAEQIERANRLIALKELGFPLESIGPVLDAELTVAQLQAMLQRRRADLETRLAADRARLTEIERRLRALEGGDMTTYDFVDKPLPALHLAQLTATCEADRIGPTVGPLFGVLGAAAAAGRLVPSGPAVAWYLPDGDLMRLAVGLPVAPDPLHPDVAGSGVETGDLPAVSRAVTVLHHGAMESIGATWQALARHVEARDLRPDGPGREIYLRAGDDVPPEEWLTELQQPVA